MRPPPPRLRPYRVFFPLAAIGGGASVVGIAASRSGLVPIPAMGDAALHGHEMLHGAFAAAFAGVVLTALPRWTGRSAPAPSTLVILAGLWAVARVAAWIAPWGGTGATTAVAALAALQVGATAAVIGFAIAAAGDRRDAIVPLLLLVMAGADALATTALLAPETAERVTFAAALGLATLIGGRVVPALTRHWAESRGRPLGPLVSRRVEIAVAVSSAAALTSFALAPESRATAGLAIVAALAGLMRLAGWRGPACLGHPSLLALHVGYAFLPLGFLAWAAGTVSGDPRLFDLARHAFGAGVFGVMCVAVQTSVVRRHDGRPLARDGFGDAAVILVFAAALARLAAPFSDDPLDPTRFAALAWIGGHAALLAAVARGWWAGR